MVQPRQAFGPFILDAGRGVLARDASSTYSGRAVDPQRAARELGVRYLLTGSVRRAGNRLRIAAHLTEAVSGTHLWGRTFDGAIGDVFDFQDRITESVAKLVE